jgi:hypothetical protein
MYKKTITMKMNQFLKIAEKKAESTQYYYNSNSVATGAFSQESNWAEGSGSSCVMLGNKPCTITVPEGQDLIDVIGGLTNDQVLAIHPSERRQ